MNEEELFKAFSDAYVKALEYLEDEREELARTQYLKMLEFHGRLNNSNAKNLLQISNKNLKEVFDRINK
ncbi:hypothetical protein HY837_03785 [archaeon]|nr:hypothetical protein [archaeon]